MADILKVPYPFLGPYMDMSKPSNQLGPGRFGRLSGVDGRYSGSLKKFYGMELARQLPIGDQLSDSSAWGLVTFCTVTESGSSKLLVTKAGCFSNCSAGDLAYVEFAGVYTNGIFQVLAASANTVELDETYSSDTTCQIKVGGRTLSNLTFCRHVTFQKGTTSYEIRGFVVRHGSSTSNQQIQLFYYDTELGYWVVPATIWDTGNSITSTTKMDCVANGKFLFVFVEGKAAKTIYWTTSLQILTMGAGNFATEDGMLAMTESTPRDSKLLTNGDMEYEGTWTKGAGWTYHTDGGYQWTELVGTGDLSQTSLDVTDGTTYLLRYSITTCNFTGGSTISPELGGTAGVARSAVGTFEEEIVCGSGAASLVFNPAPGGASTDLCIIEDVSLFELPTSYHLSGEGVYRVAFRFYDSTRNLYSALSPEVVIELNEFTDDEKYWAVLDFPNSQSGFLYTDSGGGFGELFDTVEIFRTIDLSGADAFKGAIFYKESEIAKTGNWATSGAWDSLTVQIGSLRDESLVTQISYDPETDTMIAIPQSGACGVFEGLMFVARDTSERNGVDTYWSDPTTYAPEYFTGDNLYRAQIEDGRPKRYIRAGDSLFILQPHAIVFVEKYGTAFRFSRQHIGRSLSADEAVHTIGNDAILATPLGIAVLDGKTSTMRIFTSLDRLIFGDWAGDMTDLQSCYDSYGNVSFFLNPTQNEIACIWWSNKSVTLLEGANFECCTQGLDTTSGTTMKAYFAASNGRIVTPDFDESDDGTMFGLDASSYTVNGTVTTGGTTTFVDSSGTFDDTMIGAMVFFSTGDNAGTGVEITDISGTTITVGAGLSYTITKGDQYAIAPVPFSVRLWNIPPLKAAEDEVGASRTMRRVMTSIALKVQALGDLTGNVNDDWRVGAYRNGSSSLESGTDATKMIPVDANPADSVGYLGIDGIDIEPYVELISTGANFELTNAEVGIIIPSSRDAAD